MKKLNILLALILFSTQANANEFGFLGGINFLSPSVNLEPSDASVTTASTAALIAGLTYKFSFPLIDLEIDAFYAKKKYSNAGVDINTNALEIPVLARYTFFPDFSFGLGAYYAIGLGQITSGTVSTDYTAAHYNRSDFGLLASLQLALPVAPSWNLVGDVRYNFGLAQLYSADTASIHTRELQFLAGLSYEL